MSTSRTERDSDASTPLASSTNDSNHARKSKAARDQALQDELAQLRRMNATIETLNTSLSTAKVNLATMQTNMTSAKSLLKTWTRVLNQAEHNQRLILDPQWPGATQDLQDIEAEESKRQQDTQQKIEEETRRREEAQRKLEHDAKRREENDRGRGRGLARSRSTRGSALGSSASVRGSTAQNTRGRPTTSTRGGTSGIARGVPGRGRGRG